ncbi:succinylglutamate desuccinylase/aspartoacylase family protein [Ferrimonas balearica]|uniref:succinylglutamate desuccinylase/aspartoacylase domain-containing protein n=1 Tax=Ferrimonas balearica TaxID=44012 RepID=UPI001C996C24|nr:succinylglutamate desuccinylase/aspartoacylase family protein [Ferrimonas balearica]MBY5991130.1 succinylglutamate desuccinylase/aspartoacylase family protein [Ferrimonas balearica]
MRLHSVPLPSVEQRQRGLMDWLGQLPGPAWLTLPGREPDRHRVVVTLLHGNEPSGVRALWQLWAEPPQCAVTTHFCLANLDAALFEGGFVHRHRPGQPDMNRCFGRAGAGEAYQLTAAIAERIAELAPEAVVDLHNTSGSGPSFAVTIADTEAHRALSGLFTERMLRTRVRLGALMELTTPTTPIVTIECGGALDPASDEVARAGLTRFMALDSVLTEQPATWQLDCLYDPIRVQLMPAGKIRYRAEPVFGADLTLPPDIERLNFGWLPAHSPLGWLGERGLAALALSDGLGRPPVESLFYQAGNELRLAKDSKLFMITTNPTIALSDCLFYMVVA